MEEIDALKKEVEGLRREVNHFRERWNFFEQTWMATIVEFCTDWRIAVPEGLIRQMEQRS